MLRAWGALSRRHWNALLFVPLIFGAAVFLAGLADEPVRAGVPASSSTPAPPAVESSRSPIGASSPKGTPAAPAAKAGDPVLQAGAGSQPASSETAEAAASPAPAPRSGHSGAVNPDLLPDLRPLRTAEEAPPGPGSQPDDPTLTPDPLNPVHKELVGPFREDLGDRDASFDPTPARTEEERQQLVAEGKDLFFSTTAFGQRPSQGPLVAGDVLACAGCHSGPGFADARTHVIGPVREREFGHRQTPGLFGLAGTAPYGWDGRNPNLQAQARGAIVSPLEMNASREPTKRELDALAEFQLSLQLPSARPGVDFDPERAKRGEILFRTPRPVIDPSGEFGPDDRVACATCHAGPFFTDNKFHRIALPTFFTGDFLLDPGMIDEKGNIRGFNTPSLLGVRFTSPYFHDGIAGDPTAPSNLLGGGLGAGALDNDPGATGPAAARRALLNNVLPFYNSIRFNFGFTQDELADLAEFLLTL